MPRVRGLEIGRTVAAGTDNRIRKKFDDRSREVVDTNDPRSRGGGYRIAVIQILLIIIYIIRLIVATSTKLKERAATVAEFLATGKKMGWTSLCGTSQLGWCVPEREWDDPPLGHPTLSWDAPGG